MEEKKEIRKKIFKARKEHDDAWIQEKSHVITETLTKLPEYRNAERIMAYADYNHEVITRYMIEQAWKDGKEVAVPKVIKSKFVVGNVCDVTSICRTAFFRLHVVKYHTYSQAKELMDFTHPLGISFLCFTIYPDCSLPTLLSVL